MKFTRQQRINNISSQIISLLTQNCEEFKKMLTEGVKIPEKGNEPELAATGAEIRTALGENLKPVQTVIDFVLDGKSNDITRAVKKKR